MNSDRPYSKIDCLLQGIEIIKKYETYPDIDAEHDIILVGDYEISSNQMSKEEKARMDELGWFQKYGSWAIFT